MNKKITAFICIAVALLVGISVKIYGVSENITLDEIQNSATRQNREKIAQTVLEDTGFQDRYTPSEAENIIIEFANVSNASETPKQDVIISVSFGPKDSILAVYTPIDGNQYKFVGSLGQFFDILDINTMPIPDKDYEMILIRERADQRIGAFEDSTFLKGYLWDGEKFNQVLNVPSRIKTSWNNNLLEGKKEEFPWIRINEETDISTATEPTVGFNLVHYQNYQRSTDNTSENIPLDDTFHTISERVVPEKLVWSNDWQRFIIKEGTEKSTGQKVAILEDLDNSPYALYEGYLNVGDRYRILRQDGTQDIVLKSQIDT